MRFPRAVWMTLYQIFAAAVGVGCFYAFIFFIFNLDDGLLSEDNKPAAYGVAALAIVGTIGFLFLGRLIYKSTTYIGPTIGVIIVVAIFTLPAFEAGSHVVDAFQKYRAKPYVESYMEELKATFADKSTSLNYDYIESKSETLRYWNSNGEYIWIKITKKDEAQLSVEDIIKVIDALPPAKYDVRVSINYGSNKESLNGQFSIDFTIPKKPTASPYCDSDDYENHPCVWIRELFANQGKP
ncbi:hypothetical protein [Paenibacillus sp. R14(2021)]|uniref:hypothetical protein n=1 Tax=Paenibacillus sp. R14(2021) TaxID=2859228 RepID=UPI001C615C3E|nr:hypothetical protein [Paenibacillus sp. R14(2021)]